MKFEKTYVIGAREIGFRNELTNYGFLAFLEDVASTHSDTVGYGVKDIYTKNRAWLLMDWYLEVYKRPSFCEKVYVKTWATNLEKPTFHVYRNFEVYNESKELIAIATSKWVFFDTKAQKIAKVDNELINLYNPEGDEEFAKEKIKRIKEPEFYSSTYEYVTKRSDIDMNKHMHNLNYLNLAYETLPNEIYEKEELNHIHIMYKHQIKLDDKVKCCYSFESNEHFVTIKDSEEKNVHAIIKLW